MSAQHECYLRCSCMALPLTCSFTLAVHARHAVRGYSRPSWLLPRALSPLIPVFLLATVYWGLGNNIDVAHVTSIAGVSGGGRKAWRLCLACKWWGLG